MKRILKYRRLLVIPAVFRLVLAFSSSSDAQESAADKQSATSQTPQPESSTMKQPEEMRKLAAMLVGNWSVVATLDASATRVKGRKDTGSNRIVLGPGGRSVIENYHTDGDSGSRSALGILWWDASLQGYRTMFCDNADPAGCSVYDGLGHWEGSDLVFRFKRSHDGIKVEGKEVLSAVSPFSFTVRYFESRNGGPEDATWTVVNTKAE